MLILLLGSCAQTGNNVVPRAAAPQSDAPAGSLETTVTPKGTGSPENAAQPQSAEPTPTAGPIPSLPSLISGLPGTGIEGLVTIGPTCAAVTLNNPCPDAPFAATVA